MINLKDFPKKSGVYLFLDENKNVIYVGSSNNLYKRMTRHRTDINKGFSKGNSQKDLYSFLQSNPFTVQFQLETNYRQLEQQLIERYNPKYNSCRAFTGLGAETGREAEYKKEYNQKFNYKAQKQYDKQLCNYNGEILTLQALRTRFAYRGIDHPTLEAKKYLIGDNNAILA